MYVWEFEFFESNGCIDTFLCGDFGYGVKFGDDLIGLVASVIDWLRYMVDESLMGNVELLPMEFGHELKRPVW